MDRVLSPTKRKTSARNNFLALTKAVPATLTGHRPVRVAPGRPAQYAAVVDLPPITSETLVAVALAAVVPAFAIALGGHLSLSWTQRRYRVLDVMWSPEEQQALAAARTGKGGS